MTYYDTLRINPDASPEEIKLAYRREATKWHPDRNQGNREESERRFKDIGHAYSILHDPAKRLEYDQQLKANSTNNGQSDEFSAEKAFATFLAAVLDMAFELALHGADQITIYRALIADDCPDNFAQTIAQRAYSMAHRASKGTQGGETPHKKSHNATDNIAPPRIARSSQTTSVPHAIKLTAAFILALLAGAMANSLIGDFLWHKHPVKKPTSAAELASVNTDVSAPTPVIAEAIAPPPAIDMSNPPGSYAQIVKKIDSPNVPVLPESDKDKWDAHSKWILDNLRLISTAPMHNEPYYTDWLHHIPSIKFVGNFGTTDQQIGFDYYVGWSSTEKNIAYTYDIVQVDRTTWIIMMSKNYVDCPAGKMASIYVDILGGPPIPSVTASRSFAKSFLPKVPLHPAAQAALRILCS